MYGMKTLVVVAHDDDAILWMGGTIHRLGKWDWHVVSICNQGNVQRKHYFRTTCAKLGARADALDFLDYKNSHTVPTQNSLTDIKEKLLEIVGDIRYDYVFTHSRNPDGEYSYHANHHEVCTVVEQLASEGRLVERCGLAHFCYSPIYRLPGLDSVARQDALYYFQLNYGELAFKAELIGSHIPAIVNDLEQDLGAPCPNPEAFEGDGLSLPTPFIGKNR